MSTAVEHRFGPYGGQYVPETLMPALAELESAWVEARDDPEFRAELDGLLRDYVGRPSPLYRASRLSEAAGHPVYLKREDLNHTGAHKINNALGQALLARRMGKRRIIAETGAGQHGWPRRPPARSWTWSASSTWAPRTCAARSPTSSGWACWARVEPVEAGAHAQGGRLGGDPRLGRQRRDDALHHRLVRRPGAVSRAGARPAARDRRRGRAQVLAATGRLPQRVIACVGGGSNSIGIFIPFVEDDGVELIGVEAAGEGLDSGRHGAPLTAAGRGGVLHGAYSAIMQDEDGQILEAHSISAGLDYPGSGPEHAWLRDQGRARYVAVTDARGAGRLRAHGAAGRHHPGAGERPRAGVGAGEPGQRAGPGLPLGPGGQGPGGGAGRAGGGVMAVADGVERIAEAFARARADGRRAALMPYLMGAFPIWRPRAPSLRPTPTPARTSSNWASRSPTRWPTDR